MDNAGAGMAIGIAIGAAFGSTGFFKRKRKDPQDAGNDATENPGGSKNSTAEHSDSRED